MRFVQRVAILAAAGSLAAGAAVAVTPIAAEAYPITGTGTSVTFSGSGGDYITQDQSWSYDPSNSGIDASASPDGNHVSVSINGDTFWNLDFAAPQGQALTAGTVYDNAVRYPFQGPTKPGLSLDGDGRGCNTLTGSFTVNSATFGLHGWIESFDATFVQHCEGDPNSAATGEVVLNNGPAPPEFSAKVTPAATNHVSFVSGRAVITGTMTCNRSASVNLAGTLSQRVSRKKLATGNWSATAIACSPTPAKWRATVIPNGHIPFVKGKAEIDGTYSTLDPVYQINVGKSFSRIVRLIHR